MKSNINSLVSKFTEVNYATILSGRGVALTLFNLSSVKQTKPRTCSTCYYIGMKRNRPLKQLGLNKRMLLP